MKVLRKTWKGVLAAAAAVVLCAALLLSGCSSGPYVTGIARTGGDGAQDVYTVYYSDGSTTSFTVENGADGADLNIEDVYQCYCDRYGEIEFSDFLEMYLDVNAGTTPPSSKRACNRRSPSMRSSASPKAAAGLSAARSRASRRASARASSTRSMKTTSTL